MRYWRFLLAVLICAGAFLLSACGSVTAAQEASIQKPLEQLGSGMTKSPVVTATPKPIDEALPVRLSVPSIGINAPIEQVGTLANGDMATPAQNPWIDGGWYSNGPHPGEKGSAVIDGHLDRPGGY